MDDCPFCQCDPSRVIVDSPSSAAFFDNFPIVEGHTLVVPRRHVASIYELAATEQSDVWKLVAEVRLILVQRLGVTAFNIGVNDGIDAGQTVPHAHIHVVPRRKGDVRDPRGGMRWIMAEKAAYWE